MEGKKVLISRTGYTGEDGFEIYCDPKDAVEIWRAILHVGKEFGILPIGLGARDTLRFEANLALYGQELSPDITPLEAGIGFAVKLNKEADFIGKKMLLEQKEKGVPRKLVGVEMVDQGFAPWLSCFFRGRKNWRGHNRNPISDTEKEYWACFIENRVCALGNEVFVEIRGKRLKAMITATPFYKERSRGWWK